MSKNIIGYKIINKASKSVKQVRLFLQVKSIYNTLVGSALTKEQIKSFANNGILETESLIIERVYSI